MAQQVPGFGGAVANPNKFCHGYGVFQYDIQFFLTDPDFFLQKKYAQFSGTLGKAMDELKAAAKHIHLDGKPSLTDMELCAVAIAYNTGGFNPAKGLMQGHFDGQRFYGQEVFDFLQLSRTVAVTGAAPLQPAPAGHAIIANPAPVTASGPILQVNTNISSLRVRSAPRIGAPATANVVAHLPDGHLVRAVSAAPVGNFRQIETSLNGANIQGFASTDFLAPAPQATDIPVVQPQSAPPTTGIVAVFMPPNGITKRTQIADAHSLNEPNMPDREGTTPADLCAELAAIIAYLAVDKASFKRYQPHDGLTFCNIYAHDYCHLAGVYLPRVWWTPGAIERLAQGQTVSRSSARPSTSSAPTICSAGCAISARASDGGRPARSTTCSKGRTRARSASSWRVAKRTARSGHIVAVVPETQDQHAKRDATGAVIAPLQSQAGARNFPYGTNTLNWWKGAEFAESAFWLHP